MRARNLKPGFFKNEELADIEAPWGRLLFAGLWCLADREGRLEDRPRRIKAEVFPYDEKMPSIEKMLSLLAAKQFIVRYLVDGKKYIQINKFKDHQNPHNTERRSTVPPPNIHCDLTVNPPLSNGEYLADSLNHESGIMNQESGIMNPENGASPPPPEGGNGDARRQPPAYTCECFEISEEYLEEICLKFPLLPRDYLLKAFFPRMRDWCLDNRKGKHLKKFDSQGKLRNPRSCFANWLRNEDPIKAEGYITTSYQAPPPSPPPDILVFDPDCPACRGDPFRSKGQCMCAKTKGEIDAERQRQKTSITK